MSVLKLRLALDLFFFCQLVPSLMTQQVRLVNRRPSFCTTKEGEDCVFPFKFQGRQYFRCTYADSKNPWCATKVDSEGTVITNRWGDCRISSTSLCEEEKPPASSSDCITLGGPDPGQPCRFPFVFNGETFTSCAAPVASVTQPWCSTRTHPNRTHISGQGHYGLCPPSCPGGCLAGTTYKKDCNTCVCSAQGQEVCSTTQDCSSNKSEFCGVLSGSPAESGTRCVFPFQWAGKTYNSCTPWLYGGPYQGKGWCSTKTDSKGNHVNGQGHLGFCSDSCTNVKMEPGTRSSTASEDEKNDAVVFKKVKEISRERFRKPPS